MFKTKRALAVAAAVLLSGAVAPLGLAWGQTQDQDQEQSQRQSQDQTVLCVGGICIEGLPIVSQSEQRSHSSQQAEAGEGSQSQEQSQSQRQCLVCLSRIL